MKSTGLFRNAIVVAALVTCSAAAVAATVHGPATKAVRRANDTVSRLLKKKAAPGSDQERQIARQVTVEVRDFLDIEELGRRALADHWDRLDDRQRAEYLALLRELVERSYIKGMRANVEYRVDYVGEQPKGDAVLVTTEIKTRRNGRPVTITVDYACREVDGRWRAYDVITDGVGLVENYRAQFNKIISREGFDGLLSRMRKKRDAGGQ